MLTNEQRQKAKIVGAACRRLLGNSLINTVATERSDGTTLFQAVTCLGIGYNQGAPTAAVQENPDLWEAYRRDTGHAALCEVFSRAYGQEELRAAGPDFEDLLSIGMEAVVPDVDEGPKVERPPCKRCGSGRMLQMSSCAACGRDPFDKELVN